MDTGRTIGKTIYLRQSEFNALSQAKLSYEQANGSNTDWGAFLLLLLGFAIGAKLLDTWVQNQQQNNEGRR